MHSEHNNLISCRTLQISWLETLCQSLATNEKALIAMGRRPVHTPLAPIKSKSQITEKPCRIDANACIRHPSSELVPSRILCPALEQRTKRPFEVLAIHIQEEAD